MVTDIKEIEFHDLPVESLCLNFNDQTVSLTVYKFSEEFGGDILELRLLFRGVLDFYLEKIGTIYIDEIYNCDITKVGDRSFIEFTMLYGRPSLSAIMSFSYSSVEIGENIWKSDFA